MCLSIPSLVVEIHPEDTSVTVDTLGVKRRVSCHLMSEPLELGDYVLIHIGFVMNKIDADAAHDSLEMYRKIAQQMQADDEKLLTQ